MEVINLKKKFYINRTIMLIKIKTDKLYSKMSANIPNSGEFAP